MPAEFSEHFHQHHTLEEYTVHDSKFSDPHFTVVSICTNGNILKQFFRNIIVYITKVSMSVGCYPDIFSFYTLHNI